MGPAQRSADGAVAKGAVRPAAGRTHLLREPGAAQVRAVASLRVPGLQEAAAHRPHLYCVADAQDGRRPRPLDHARRRAALRHQISK